MNILKIFKALADETRIRILSVLREGTLCVCEIERALEITQSNASRHLIKLSDAGIISSTKKSIWVYYHIDEKVMRDHPFLQEFMKTEFDQLPICNDDIRRLNELRENGLLCD